MPASFSVRSTSSAASTPSTPSNLPPVGWVSRCEPKPIGGLRHVAAPAQREHVAERVDANLAAGLLAGGAKPVAHLLVFGAERQPPHAALRRGAEPRGVVDGAPQPRRIDLQVGGGFAHARESVVYSLIKPQPVIARSVATKQSRIRARCSGLLRFARNDGERPLISLAAFDGPLRRIDSQRQLPPSMACRHRVVNALAPPRPLAVRQVPSRGLVVSAMKPPACEISTARLAMRSIAVVSAEASQLAEKVSGGI